MKKRMTLWQRAVAMLLALQMTAAPVAMARATDLLFVSVTEEQAMLTSANGTEAGDTGTDPETGATDPTYQLDQDAGQYFVDGNASLLNTGATTPVTNVRVSLSMGAPVSVLDSKEYLEWFKVGTDNYTYGVEDPQGTFPYGWRSKTISDVSTDDTKTSYYFTLPTAEEIGRVPDKEFVGFYLHPDRANLRWLDALSENYRTTREEQFSSPAKDWGKEEYSFEGYDPLDSDLASVLTTEAKWTEWADLNTNMKRQHDEAWWVANRESDRRATVGIPVIGRWTDSTIARFTDFGFTWTNDAAGNTTTTTDTTIYTMDAELGGPDTARYIIEEAGVLAALEGADGEYFIQVTSGTKSLDLSFNSFEPYWNYHTKQAEAKCPVSVTVTVYPEGKEKKEEVPPQTSEIILSLDDSQMGMVEGETGIFAPVDLAPTTLTLPTNSPANPARAQWTLPNIELTGQDTEVTITLTAPDGVTTRKVTFHIRKLEDPILIKAPGNTPFGMIDRDTAADWGSTDEEIEENKATAKDMFGGGGEYSATYRFDTTYYPQDIIHHQGGEIFKEEYQVEAWQGLVEANLDLRSDAIVVYQDSVGLDPGITLYASRGINDKVGLGDLTTTVTVLVADGDTPLTPGLVGMEAGTDIDGDDKADVTEMTWELDFITTTDEETGEQKQNYIIDLQRQKVLPGIYSIEYSYSDWYIGQKINSSNKGAFSDTTLADNFSRPLVVLPAPGDVDMDGAVTHADAVALQAYIDSEPDESDPAVALFLYRVCDVTYDGKVNDEDVAALEEGFHPEVHKPDDGGSSDYWYIPLPDGGYTKYSRKNWSDLGVSDQVETTSLFSRFLSLFSTEEPTNATISLEYLGVEQGAFQEDNGTTSGATGPWAADPESKVALGEYDSTANEGEVFWMGVKLSDVAQSTLLNGKAVDSLTLTVTYDSRYVEPAYVVPAMDSDTISSMNDMDRWRHSVMRYNLGALSSGKTLWGTDTAYGLTSATQYDLGYTTHYSKVISHLEEDLKVGSQDLKQLTFSISLNSGRPAAKMADGYLVALPFKLVKHPFDQETLRAVELSAGMRELTLVSVDQGSLSGEVTSTAAYSAQTEIFGDSTQNLNAGTGTGGVTYANVLANIPLGENKTEYTAELVATYGEQVTFDARHHIPQGAVVDPNTLPPGLTYTDSWQLTGIPTQAKIDGYEFMIKGELFRLVVNKKVINCSVNSANTYYGETEYRGTHGNRDFTFTYNANDLYEEDAKLLGITQTTDGELTRGGEDLAGLAGFTAPTFTAKDTAGNAVDYKSAAGGYYAITTQTWGELENYELDFNNTGKTLTILSRPVVVNEISPTNVGEIYMDGSPTDQTDDMVGTVVKELTADSARNSFTLAHPTDHEYKAKQPTGDALVEGDSLTVSYTATWLQVAKDVGGKTSFTVAEGKSEEYRPVELFDLVLGGDSKGNYQLVHTTLNTNPTAGSTDFNVTVPDDGGPPAGYSGAYGVVTGRVVTDIVITSVPSYFNPAYSVTHGTTLTGADRLTLDIYTSSQVHGNYAFSSEVAEAWNVHVNFVTKDEMEKGENGTTVVDGKVTDLNPYYDEMILTHTEHDGRYLCVSATVTDEETDKTTVVNQYSTYPITVNPRILTLTAQDVTRFYGEGNGDLTYIYNPNELASHDGKILSDLRATEAWKGIARGSREELEKLMAELDAKYGTTYKKPSIEVVTVLGAEVDEYTAAGTPCVIELSGAATTCPANGEAALGNYIFRYVNSDEPDGYSETVGKASLTILPRRVVVDSLTADGGKRVFDEVRLYADTKDITTKNVINETNDGGQLTLSLDDVFLTTPDLIDGGTGGIIYHGNNGTSTTHVVLRYPMSGTTILSDDRDKLELTYTATVVPDNGSWTNFGSGYFATGTWGDGAMEKNYPVQVGSLALTGAAADNYELVYKTADTAQKRTTANAVPVTAPAADGTGNSATYHTAYTKDGNKVEVTVYRRPVVDLEISGLPTMSYTSGDTFRPAGGLKVDVLYSTAYDNLPKGVNVTSETVTYGLSSFVGGVRQTTFDERGFTIGYINGDKSGIINHSTYLTCVDHDGARIFVAGKNSKGEPIESGLTDDTLEVSPRTLTLTINDIHRFYGEPNTSGVTVPAGTLVPLSNPDGGFTFTFDEEQLSPEDQEILKSLGLTGQDGAKALEKLGLNFDQDPPTYSTTARQDSDASATGYPVTATGGSLDNYTLNWVAGNVYVYPRPVQVDSFDNEEDWPIYTIYNDLNIQTLTTEIRRMEEGYKIVDDKPVPYSRVRFSLSLPLETYHPQTAVNGARYELPLTGPAIYGYRNNGLDGDNLTIRATVNYPANIDLEGKSSATYPVTLTNLSIVPGSENSQNYMLYSPSAGDNRSQGAVALRELVSIRVYQAPGKMEYTYGESLDLSGLAVEITYGIMNNEVDQTTREKVIVSYIGPDHFKSHGLYVDYSDLSIVEEKGDQNADHWRNIIQSWRSADSGDHVTIAPSHDDPGFAHNGQYLIISGQLDETHTPVKPVIVREVSDPNGDNGAGVYGDPIPIKVNPLKLTFTLSAEDKTYDGNTAAAGTLVLTNVFNRPTGIVDAYNRNGVTDVVFVKTGAAYETPEGNDTTHLGYGAFKAHVADNDYTFTTGSYKVNEPWPLGANGTIQWVDGYQGLLGQPGCLTFNFVDPNVRYLDDKYAAAVAAVGGSIDYWTTGQAVNEPDGIWDTFGTVAAMPVEVTGMVLAGPDAANYTWAWEEDWAWTADNANRVSATEVRMSTPDVPDDGQDAVPFATIHKANRQTIWSLTSDRLTPTVAVDRHTNVVQVTWEQDVAKVMEQESDRYKSETHFEYALLYVDNETGELRQWAGNDGTAGWQDTLYFGGEFVDPGVPGGYVPDPDDLPTAEDVAEEDFVFKGQIYRWLAEDGGVWIEGTFYPNDTVQLGYDLLDSKRAALPRDTVFWPIVRVAETHNYLSSPVLSGDDSLTAELVDDWMKAKADYDAQPTDANLALVESAADAVIAQLDDTDAAARKAADDEVTYVKGLAAEGDWPEDNIWTDPAPTAAVKTFKERIDVISVTETESFVETDETGYRVPTLEAVWFTDLMEYPEKSYMDVVLRNNEPTRYYDYYWDQWKSAELEFDEEAPIDLSGPISGIEVTYDDENGDKVETTITVNTDGILKLYVKTTGSGGIPIRDFFVEPSYIVARVGDEPIQLTVTFIPENATHTRLNWLTSDPAVATVKYGVVTIVGPGTATITAVTQNGHRREIQVLVLTAEQLWGGIFNWGYTDAWFDLEKDGLFHPLREMTRGEVAWTLAKLYVPSETWNRSGPSYFSDLTGEEYYYDAAILLGSEGVILGMPGGEFQGEKTITRGEFAAMMARMMDLPMPDPLTSEAIYSDVAVGEHWAWAYIHAMSAVGAMHGVGDGQFAPDAILTRAEAATVIARLLHKQIDTEQKDWVVPLDVSEPDWFYWYVVRAVNNIGAVSDLME